MTRDDLLPLEDVVMRFAAYVHALAVQINPDARNRSAIDETWSEFKADMGRRFSRAESEIRKPE